MEPPQRYAPPGTGQDGPEQTQHGVNKDEGRDVIMKRLFSDMRFQYDCSFINMQLHKECMLTYLK